MIVIDQIKISGDKFPKTAGELEEILIKKAAKACKIKTSEILSMEILKKSIDARKKPEIFYSFSVVISTKNADRILKNNKLSHVRRYEKRVFKLPEIQKRVGLRPVVVGFGPAGIAAAYCLANRGFNPIIIERGGSLEERVPKVDCFWETGTLDTETNVQFGEGGAGAFSDGKLNTGNRDRDGIQRAILKTLVKFGAPENILYDSKPHIGTDILRNVVKSIREEIISLGGEFRFNTKLVDIATTDENVDIDDGVLKRRTVSSIAVEKEGKREEIETSHIILAIGHSARDTYRMLYDLGISLDSKPFAVGYRVTHLQSFINNSQYGSGYEAKGLPAANYKLTYTCNSGRPAFSFCMCPGGYIVNASSEEGKLCVNGMSYSGRDGKYANSAIVMGITPEEIPGILMELGGEVKNTNPISGIRLLEELEERAYRLAKGVIPVVELGGEDCPSEYKDAFKGSVAFVPNLIEDNLILPERLNRDFLESMQAFSKSIRGFNEKCVFIAGIETRTSSPIRILRSGDFQSVNIKGIYPCGEGAGYAGGIMSAVADGIRAAGCMLQL